MATRTTKYTYSIDVGTTDPLVLSVSDAQTAGEVTSIDESVTDGADQLVAFTLDISQTKAFAIWSDGGDMTVETNNGTTPDDTFTLVDGKPVVWSSGKPGSPAIPLTADVTALYVTNTGTATLRVEALADPTV